MRTLEMLKAGLGLNILTILTIGQPQNNPQKSSGSHPHLVIGQKADGQTNQLKSVRNGVNWQVSKVNHMVKSTYLKSSGCLFQLGTCTPLVTSSSPSPATLTGQNNVQFHLRLPQSSVASVFFWGPLVDSVETAVSMTLFDVKFFCNRFALRQSPQLVPPFPRSGQPRPPRNCNFHRFPEETAISPACWILNRTLSHKLFFHRVDIFVIMLSLELVLMFQA